MAQARRNRKNKTPAWVWLVIGILLGFFFSHVDVLEAYRFLEHSLEKNQKTPKRGSLAHVQKEETKFDFYHILSGKPAEPDSRLHLEVGKQQRNTQRKATKIRSPEPPFLPSAITPKRQQQEKLTDLDAATQTHLPPLQKGRVTQLPPLNKQKKSETSEKPLRQVGAQPVQLEAPKNKSFQGKTALSELGSPSKPKEKAIKSTQEEKSKTGNFTLQIAALRSYAEADRYKAQLLLLGFQGIRIQKVMKGQNIWFRVTVGNYTSRQEADAAKKKLQQNRISGIVIPR